MAVSLETKCPQITSGLLTDPVETLVLRAYGPQHHGELLRISTAKCSIGSSHHCTLRIVSPGVAPFHCLILRGPGGAVIKRWDGETQLNGRDFTEATLRTNDRVRCGTVELEVVAGLQPVIGMPEATEMRAVSVTLPKGQPRPVAQAQRAVPNDVPSCTEPPSNTDVERLKTTRDLLRGRMRRLLSQWRSSRWELARYQADARRQSESGQELQQRIAELEQQIADHREQLTQSDRRSTDSDAKRTALLSQVESLTTCRDELQRRFEVQSQQWETERAALETQLAAARQDVANSKELHARLQAAEDLSNVAQQQCTAFADELQRLHERHQATLSELQERASAVPAPLVAADGPPAVDATLEANAIEPAPATPMIDREMQASLDQWRTQAETAEAAAANAREAMVALQQQVDELKAQVVTSASQAEELEKLCVELESRLSTTPSVPESPAEIEQKFAAVAGLLETLRSQNDDLHQQLTELQHEHADVTSRFQAVETARTEMERQVQELSAQLAEKSHHDSAALAHDPAAAHFERELSQWKQVAEGLQRRVEELEHLAHESESTRRRREFAERLGLPENVANAEKSLEPTDLETHAGSPTTMGDDVAMPMNAEEVFQSPLLASLLRTKPDSEERPEVAEHEGPMHDETVHHVPDLNVPPLASPADAYGPQDVDETMVSMSLAAKYGFSTSPESDLMEMGVHADESGSVPNSFQGAAALMSDEMRESLGGSLRENPLQGLSEESATDHSTPVSDGESTTQVTSPTPANEDEESIEDYMARLLQRVRGDTAPAPASQAPREAVKEVKAAIATQAPTKLDETVADGTATPTKPIQQYMPRVIPAALRENMTTMREIANSSAKKALDTHQRKGMVEKSQAKLFGSVCASVASAAILYFAGRGPQNDNVYWQYATAILGLTVAAYWTFEGSILSRKSQANRAEK